MDYEQNIRHEVESWRREMMKDASLFGSLSKQMQTRVNSYIPDRVHNAITAAIREMTRGILFGAKATSSVPPPAGISLQVREQLVQDRIKFYRNAATAEGIATGAGGFLLGLADFPIWLTLKMKMLFEIATLYGAGLTDYRERVFILHIFQLTFSSQQHRKKVFHIMDHWDEEVKKLPSDIRDLDWRAFQQEYRDYIDIAKLLQLVPGIGAVVGGVVNHRLTSRLGTNAVNAYRLRWPLASPAKLFSRPAIGPGL